MDAMLSRALRKYAGLRHHVDQVLVGDDSGIWEAELKKFLRHEPCWTKGAEPNLRFDKRQDGWTLLEHQPRRIVSATGLELVPFLRSGEDSIDVVAQSGVFPERATEHDIHGQPPFFNLAPPCHPAPCEFWRAV